MRVKCVSVSRSCPRPTGGGTVRPSPLSITLLDLSPWTSSKHRAQLADAVRAGRGRRQPRRDDAQHLARRVPRRLADLRSRARRRNRRGALPAPPPQADEQLVEVRPRVAGSGTGSRLRFPRLGVDADTNPVGDAASVADRAEGEQRGEDEEACEEDLRVALAREDAHPREVEVEGGDAGDVPRGSVEALAQVLLPLPLLQLHHPQGERVGGEQRDVREEDKLVVHVRDGDVVHVASRLEGGMVEHERDEGRVEQVEARLEPGRRDDIGRVRDEDDEEGSDALGLEGADARRSRLDGELERARGGHPSHAAARLEVEAARRVEAGHRLARALLLRVVAKHVRHRQPPHAPRRVVRALAADSLCALVGRLAHAPHRAREPQAAVVGRAGPVRVRVNRAVLGHRAEQHLHRLSARVRECRRHL
mmetsp:Transcript_34347/g.107746  ORF Transcript_34347/g.107746 Transcript_34347/m.107746 type:complete len:421 (-) Transcript_34347:437-1699(-)